MKFKLSDISSMKYGSLPKHKSVDGQYPIFTGYKTSGYSDEFNVEDPEIVVVARGVGGTGDVKMAPGPAWITNLSIIVRVNPDLVNKKYLQLKLAGMGLRYLDSGSAQSQITIKDLSEVKIDLPDLDVQTKVAKTIQMFEDKISNLQAINDNLLELSMTHFEHWLETTSSTNNVSLDEIATYKNGLAMQKFEPENAADSLPVLKIRELNQGFTDASSNRARTDIDESVTVYDGDVIFSWSGTLLVDIWTGGTAGLNQHLFKVTSDAYPKWFYYMWTRYHLRQFQQIAAGKATTMGHIKRGDLKAANVIIPTDSEFAQLETLLKPVVDAYIENGVEIKNLQTIRDQLLQKLLA